MKIAVTYENGNVFQHFGRTEQFKLYEIQEGKILSEEIIGTNGTGHEALAGVLAAQGVVLVICGGLGGGMQSALDAAGIAVISGASGDADEAVAAFLRGELDTAGVNCDHHGEGAEEEGCGGGCHGGDAEGCGGGCGGCGIGVSSRRGGIRRRCSSGFNDGLLLCRGFGFFATCKSCEHEDSAAPSK